MTGESLSEENTKRLIVLSHNGGIVDLKHNLYSMYLLSIVFWCVIYGMRPKTSCCRLMKRVVPFLFNIILLSVHDPFLIRSKSVRNFRPF